MTLDRRFPIDDVLPELMAQLSHRSVAVLEAAPGAGKTTRVPLALLDAAWLNNKKIVMLEPRRIAARTAALYMAKQLGESVGETVGYRMRGEARISSRTRIEIVTEGVLSRIRASDPLLLDYGAVIFDEFHERTLQSDLAVALVLQTQELLRPDLRIVVMSATLNGNAVADLLADSAGGASVVRCEGRRFPVETLYRTPREGEHISATAARATKEAVQLFEGDVLVFLPGWGEQRRTYDLLELSLPNNVDLYTLHGSHSLSDQELAISSSPSGRRKVVLATSVAETSVTIEGVRVVIDCGLTRLPRHSVRTGLTRLDTVRVSRASADQRRGRAGRVAPGVCIRLWDVHEDASLADYTRPEIVDTDLSHLALELAANGVVDSSELRWLDAPPVAAMTVARDLLRQLDAIDANGAISGHGKQLLKLPTAPRLAHMLIHACEVDGVSGNSTTQSTIAVAAVIAALVGERDILQLPRAESFADLRTRLEAMVRFSHGRSDSSNTPLPYSREAMTTVRRAAGELYRRLPLSVEKDWLKAEAAMVDDLSCTSTAGALVALAWPDRIAQQRVGSGTKYIMANGRGAKVSSHDTLSGERFLAVAAIEDGGAEAQITLAAPITEEDIRSQFASNIEWIEYTEWDEGTRTVRAWKREKLGALVLAEQRIAKPDAALVYATLRDVLVRSDVSSWPISESAQELRLRMAFVQRHDESWPAVSDAALRDMVCDASSPLLHGVTSWKELAQVDWRGALLSLMSWEQRSSLDQLAPTGIVVPSGSRHSISYSDSDAPVLAVRLQEVFGLTETPRIMNKQVPLTLHLLSPANRPVQVTQDLAGFWRSSYFEVRRELRGRYPRHVWPEDPLTEPATRRAKPRGT